MAENEVIQLVKGMIRRQEGVVLEAHSSSTLVVCGKRRIVVDTSTPQRRGELLSSLEGRGISPQEVDTVVFTHLHGDHTGNQDLFTGARFLAHADEIPPPWVEPVLEDGEICPGVMLMHTPGHSKGSMTVVVEAERMYAIAGDAIPTRSNYVKWVPPNLNYYPELALKSMGRIVACADIIIPGHDEAFEVDR